MRKTLIAFVATAATLVASVASASSIYNLTVDHCTGGCGTAPFGTVTLTQTGTTVDILVHLLNGDSFVKTGAADDQAFKFNAVGVVLADITIDAHVPGLAASTGAFNGDGTGSFAFGINCPSCGSGSSDAFLTNISFHIANATIADLTAANSDGFVFVADILGTTGNTGPVAATATHIDQQGCDGAACTSAVPEPATLTLLGTGLAGLALGIRRRRRS